MDIKRLYFLVKNFFGYKCKMIGINSEKKEVKCILYDSFFLTCTIDDRYGRFGAGLVVGNNEVITDFLGKRCSLNSDETSIKESLSIVDNYCRLRLPDKFLKEYYKAYVLDYYQEDDISNF